MTATLTLLFCLIGSACASSDWTPVPVITTWAACQDTAEVQSMAAAVLTFYPEYRLAAWRCAPGLLPKDHV